MMWESLLGVLLVTFIFILALLIVIPELLKWLAGRNVRWRQRLIHDYKQVRRAHAQTAARLAPFANMQARAYRRAYLAAEKNLTLAKEKLDTITRLSHLRFPKIPAAGWPIVHFLTDPQQAPIIVAAATGLWQIQRSVSIAKTAISAASKEMDSLDLVPERLQQSCRDLVSQRLPHVESALAGEHRAGITALADLTTTLQHLQQKTHELERALQSGGHSPLAQMDRHAQTLEEVTAATSELEADLKSIHGARTRLDTQLKETETALERLLATANRDDVAQLLHPLAIRIGTLLVESRQLRQSRAFGEAGQCLVAARQLIDLGNALYQAVGNVVYLSNAQPGSFLKAELQAILDHWRQLVAEAHRLAEPLSGEEKRSRLPLPDPEIAPALIKKLQQLQAHARQLQDRHEKQSREQEQRARRAATALTKAWQKLQTTVKLDADPLAQNYRQLLQRRSEAAGQPQPLFTFSQAAEALTQELKAVEADVRDKLQTGAVWMENFPPLVAAAEEQWRYWPCLKEPFQTIHKCATTAENLWQGVTTQGQLNQIQQSLRRIEELVIQARQAEAEIQQRLHHLTWLEDNIEECFRALDDNADEVSLANSERVTSLVEHHWRRARLTEDFSEAMTALEEAYDVAKSLLFVGRPPSTTDGRPLPTDHRPPTTDR